MCGDLAPRAQARGPRAGEPAARGSNTPAGGHAASAQRGVRAGLAVQAPPTALEDEMQAPPTAPVDGFIEKAVSTEQRSACCLLLLLHYSYDVTL